MNDIQMYMIALVLLVPVVNIAVIIKDRMMKNDQKTLQNGSRSRGEYGRAF